MGMFDSFIGFDTKCPGCGGPIGDEFQTKTLFCCLYRWKKGDPLHIPQALDEGEVCDIYIDRGTVTAYDYCDTCERMVMADIVIKGGKVADATNIRLDKKR